MRNCGFEYYCKGLHWCLLSMIPHIILQHIIVKTGTCLGRRFTVIQICRQHYRVTQDQIGDGFHTTAMFTDVELQVNINMIWEHEMNGYWTNRVITDSTDNQIKYVDGSCDILLMISWQDHLMELFSLSICFIIPAIIKVTCYKESR